VRITTGAAADVRASTDLIGRKTRTYRRYNVFFFLKGTSRIRVLKPEPVPFISPISGQLLKVPNISAPPALCQKKKKQNHSTNRRPPHHPRRTFQTPAPPRAIRSLHDGVWPRRSVGGQKSVVVGGKRCPRLRSCHEEGASRSASRSQGSARSPTRMLVRRSARLIGGGGPATYCPLGDRAVCACCPRLGWLSNPTSGGRTLLRPAEYRM